MFKNYSFVNGNNIETNSYGAPYQSNIVERFFDNRIIEHAVIGGDSQKNSK
jgi:hypothetical protein